MLSFEQPTEWWTYLVERLKQPLDDTEAIRGDFQHAEQKVARSVAQIAGGRVLDATNQERLAPLGRYAPHTSTEALSFLQRRHIGEEALRYRRTVEDLHATHGTRSWCLESVVDLHRSLLPPESSHAGLWKNFEHHVPKFAADGRIIGTSALVIPQDVPRYMQSLFDRFDDYWKDGRIPKPLLIAAFVMDFFQIHPFADGNGRTARLVMLWLFYRSGHSPFRFASLEDLISRRRIEYIAALQDSQFGWRDQRHDLFPWAKFLLEVLAGGYQQARSNIARIVDTADRINDVAVAITRMPARFQRNELLGKHPNLDHTWADLMLARHCENGLLYAAEDGGAVTFARTS